jgi:hypothetical protein
MVTNNFHGPTNIVQINMGSEGQQQKEIEKEKKKPFKVILSAVFSKLLAWLVKEFAVLLPLLVDQINQWFN